MEGRKEERVQKIKSLVPANTMPRHGVKTPPSEKLQGSGCTNLSCWCAHGKLLVSYILLFSTELTTRYSYHLIFLLFMGNNRDLIYNHQ